MTKMLRFQFDPTAGCSRRGRCSGTTPARPRVIAVGVGDVEASSPSCAARSRSRSRRRSRRSRGRARRRRGASRRSRPAPAVGERFSWRWHRRTSSTSTTGTSAPPPVSVAPRGRLRGERRRRRCRRAPLDMATSVRRRAGTSRTARPAASSGRASARRVGDRHVDHADRARLRHRVEEAAVELDDVGLADRALRVAGCGGVAGAYVGRGGARVGAGAR